MTESVIDEITEIVGNGAIYTDVIETFPYGMDGTLFTGNSVPEIVVQPRNSEQIAKILKIASEHRIPVTPRGNGTSLSGNPVPVFGGILLDLSRMDVIVDINIANNIVIVEPGVVCDKLNECLDQYGYFFPPDPGSSSAATIGGMVANNSGGLQAFKYGVTSNYVLWLEVVLPSGKIVHFGSKTLKSVSSINLTGLMIGSEGTLGVITKIALKIKPKPMARKTGFYIFNRFETITAIIIEIRKAGIIPNMQEFLDKTTSDVCFNYLGGDYADYPRGYFLLLETDGIKEQVDHEFSLIHEICLRYDPTFHKIASSAADRANIIQARKVALPALSGIAPTTLLEDCTINISNLGKALADIEKIAEDYAKYGLEIATFGHLEGNLHPTFMFNEHKEEQVEKFEEAVDRIYQEVVLPLGGTTTGEHGVGFLKTKFFKQEHSDSVELMYKIKEIFDPQHILNPGKAKGGDCQGCCSPVDLPQKDLSSTPPLSCMRCGFCVVECPAYKEFRHEAYSPRGKLAIMRGLLRGNIKMNRKVRDIMYACTLCGACQISCPALIETVELFEETRKLILAGSDKKIESDSDQP